MLKKVISVALCVIVVAFGCFCEFRQNEIKDLIDADIILGNKDKSKVIDYIKEFEKTHQRIIKFYDMNEVEFEDMEIKKYAHHHRAFIKQPRTLCLKHGCCRDSGSTPLCLQHSSRPYRMGCRSPSISS